MNQPSYDFSTAEDIIAQALLYLEDRLRYQPNTALNGSQNIFDYARLQLAHEKEEVFAVFFLCDKYRLLAFEKFFYGASNTKSTYIGAIVKKAIKYNSTKVIITRSSTPKNHTSSVADKKITRILKYILKMIDIELVDYAIASQQKVYSFAEHGLL